MAHDVFISYAATDKAVADAVCAQLEAAHKVRCWIAPRDLTPGASSTEACMSALDRSKIMVLILSTAHASARVDREVERAVQQGINVVPMRIDKAMAAETLEYAPGGGIRSTGAPGTLAGLICHLAESVKALLEQLPAAAVKSTAVEAPESGSKWSWIVPAIFGVVIIVAVIVVGLPLFEGPRLRVGEPGADSRDTAPLSTPGPSDSVDQTPATDARPPLPPTGSDLAGSSASADGTGAVSSRREARTPTAAPATGSPQSEGLPPSQDTPGRPAPEPASGPGPTVRGAPDGVASKGDAASVSGALESGTRGAVGLTPSGTVVIDFLNTYPDGSVEVEVDGRKEWSRRLKLSQSGGALARLRLQRVSEQLGSEFKVSPGDHKITVTMLNADGEVRDTETTNLHVDASRSVTLRIRVTRFRNRLQLESVAG